MAIPKCQHCAVLDVYTFDRLLPPRRGKLGGPSSGAVSTLLITRHPAVPAVLRLVCGIFGYGSGYSFFIIRWRDGEIKNKQILSDTYH